MNLKKIKSAIISVSEKSNLKQILPILKKFNVKIINNECIFISGNIEKEIVYIKWKIEKVS